MYTYAASPQGLSSPTASAAGSAAAAAGHHYHHLNHHHAHAAAAYHQQMLAPHPPHHPYSSTTSSPSTVTAISSPPTLLQGASVGGALSGGYLTSPTGSSIQLLGSPSHHNNGAHPLIGLQGGSSGVGDGLQDPQVAMQLAGGSGSGMMMAPTYDGAEMTEMKKRR